MVRVPLRRRVTGCSPRTCKRGTRAVTKEAASLPLCQVLLSWSVRSRTHFFIQRAPNSTAFGVRRANTSSSVSGAGHRQSDGHSRPDSVPLRSSDEPSCTVNVRPPASHAGRQRAGGVVCRVRLAALPSSRLAAARFWERVCQDHVSTWQTRGVLPDMKEDRLLRIGCTWSARASSSKLAGDRSRLFFRMRSVATLKSRDSGRGCQRSGARTLPARSAGPSSHSEA